MKTKHLLTMAILLPVGFFLASCQKKPTACFTYEEIGQACGDHDYEFTNCSTEAASYRWDFGDGGTSISAEPNHCFASGTFVVKLTAISENNRKIDEVTKTITIS